MSTDVYQEARLELKGFLYESPKFRNDIEKLIIKFIDKKFLLNGFSPTISSLIKSMANPWSKRISVDDSKYLEILGSIVELATRHKDTYKTFIAIVRAYAWNKHSEKIGYCKLVRLIMGESPNSINDHDGFARYLIKVYGRQDPTAEYLEVGEDISIEGLLDDEDDDLDLLLDME